MKPTAHMTLNLMPLAIRRAISDGKSNDPIAMASLALDMAAVEYGIGCIANIRSCPVSQKP